uniref:G_PROTEIN_RECEP_F2_4 domain-containing protein n=1 Tax=Steinernema glaseri TaxID=37863 RepID=A0A1I7ZQL9_9BILA
MHPPWLLSVFTVFHFAVGAPSRCSEFSIYLHENRRGDQIWADVVVRAYSPTEILVGLRWFKTTGSADIYSMWTESSYQRGDITVIDEESWPITGFEKTQMLVPIKAQDHQFSISINSSLGYTTFFDYSFVTGKPQIGIPDRSCLHNSGKDYDACVCCEKEEPTSFCPQVVDNEPMACEQFQNTFELFNLSGFFYGVYRFDKEGYFQTQEMDIFNNPMGLLFQSTVFFDGNEARPVDHGCKANCLYKLPDNILSIMHIAVQIRFIGIPVNNVAEFYMNSQQQLYRSGRMSYSDMYTPLNPCSESKGHCLCCYNFMADTKCRDPNGHLPTPPIEINSTVIMTPTTRKGTHPTLTTSGTMPSSSVATSTGTTLTTGKTTTPTRITTTTGYISPTAPSSTSPPSTTTSTIITASTSTTETTRWLTTSTVASTSTSSTRSTTTTTTLRPTSTLAVLSTTNLPTTTTKSSPRPTSTSTTSTNIPTTTVTTTTLTPRRSTTTMTPSSTTNSKAATPSSTLTTPTPKLTTTTATTLKSTTNWPTSTLKPITTSITEKSRMSPTISTTTATESTTTGRPVTTTKTIIESPTSTAASTTTLRTTTRPTVTMAPTTITQSTTAQTKPTTVRVTTTFRPASSSIAASSRTTTTTRTTTTSTNRLTSSLTPTTVTVPTTLSSSSPSTVSPTTSTNPTVVATTTALPTVSHRSTTTIPATTVTSTTTEATSVTSRTSTITTTTISPISLQPKTTPHCEIDNDYGENVHTDRTNSALFTTTKAQTPSSLSTSHIITWKSSTHLNNTSSTSHWSTKQPPKTTAKNNLQTSTVSVHNSLSTVTGTSLTPPYSSKTYFASTTSTSEVTENVTTTATTTTTESPSCMSSPACSSLYNITHIPITPLTVEHILRNVTRNIGHRSVNLTGDEIYYLSIIIQRIAQSGPLTDKIVDEVATVIDLTLEAQQDQFAESDKHARGSTERILDSIDIVLRNSNSSVKYLTGNNLALAAHNPDCSGLTTEDEGLADYRTRFDIVSRDVEKATNPSASISIPLNTICSANVDRVSYVIYRNTKLFVPVSQQPKRRRRSVSSQDEVTPPPKNRCKHGKFMNDGRVLSATALKKAQESYEKVSMYKDDANGTEATMAVITYSNIDKLEPLHGKFGVSWWKDASYWSGDLCVVQTVTGGYEARCTHLTDFTLIVDGLLTEPCLCDSNLVVLGYVMGSFSLLGLIFLSVLYSSNYSKLLRDMEIIRKLRGNPSATADDAVSVLYIVTMLAFYLSFTFFSDKTIAGSACNTLAGVNYWLLLSCLSFTMCQALRTLRVFAWSSFMEKMLYYVTRDYIVIGFSYVISSLVVLTFAVTITDFFKRNDDYCWIRPDWVIVSVVVPLSILVVCGFICFALIILRLFPNLLKRDSSRSSSRAIHRTKNHLKRKIVAILLMQFTLGIPWVFQYLTLFAPQVTAWHYLFTIVNGSQGVTLFLLYLYRRILLQRQKRQSKKLASLHTSSRGREERQRAQSEFYQHFD